MPRVKRWVSRITDRPLATLIRWWPVPLGAALVIVSWLPVNWVKLAATAWETMASAGFSGIVFISGIGVLATSAINVTAQTRQRKKTDKNPAVSPLRWWWVGLIAAGIAIVTGIALWWLMGIVSQSPPDRVNQARVEAVRTALTLGAGLVGMVALVLTSRKQWLAEHTQRHTEADATEQRATELYAAAAEQLASDKAPVRLAGLYALERLGQYNSAHRQTVVNLLCAYLRMPFTHPDAKPAISPTSATSDDKHPNQEPAPKPLLLDLAPSLANAVGVSNNDADQRRQEFQVRMTAQRIIRDHLQPNLDHDSRPTNSKFWADIVLDLTGAVLDNFDLSGCHASSARFGDTHFHGRNKFVGTHFLGEAWFDQAHFHGVGKFEGAHFHDEAWFGYSHFEDAWFDGVHFHGKAVFEGAKLGGTRFNNTHFHNRAWFGQAVFNEEFSWRSDFIGTHFHGEAGFTSADFHGGACFDGAHFHLPARFDDACFFDALDADVQFNGTRVRWDVDRSRDIWPTGWTVKPSSQSSEFSQIDGLEGPWGFVVQVARGTS